MKKGEWHMEKSADKVKVLAACAFAAVSGFVLAEGDVVIENARMTLRIGADACAKSLVIKQTGEECLDVREKVPLFATTQERPFNNEIKLAYPNKRTTYPANRIRKDGERLIVGFELAPYEAIVKIVSRDDYIAFELEDFISDTVNEKQYRRLMMDVPPVASFRLLQLPVADRKNFGEWVNAVWDDSAAVAVMATDPFAEIDHVRSSGCRILTADVHKSIKLRGGTAAVVAAAGRTAFLDAVAKLESDFGMPRGVESRRSPLINASICWTDTLRPSTVDDHIAFAKKGGFRLMLIYYHQFTPGRGWSYLGDYDPDPKYYPRGYEDIREMLAKIRAAGILPGLHMLQTHIGLKSRYVTPVADPRLNHTRRFTLASPLPLGTEPCEIEVFENPVDSPVHPKCRVLQFGGELFGYTGYTTQPPYKFTGVTRGHCATRPQEHPFGQVGGVLDVSEFAALSCYIDQRTTLQDEVAEKIARLYDCGFAFCYMDGSEGVNPPCGINVSFAQYRVARKFKTPPLFTEGAAKSHFGWHLQAGANAYDVFPPEVFKEKIVEYPQANAPLMQRNFTRLDFGWWAMTVPGEKPLGKNYASEFGVQSDMWEWGTSRAAAWDCPATVHLNPAHVARHPRATDLLEVMRRWEDVRATNWLTPERKEALKSKTQEHHLIINGKGEYELVEIEEIKGVLGGKVKAFLFVRGGERYVAFWDASGERDVTFPQGFAFSLHAEPDASSLPVSGRTVRLSSRVYLRTGASSAEVRAAFAALK